MQNFKFYYNYYICNSTLLVAENHKAASTSIAKAILAKYYPSLYAGIQSNATISFRVYHDKTPKTDSCIGKDVVTVIRDPIDRFISLVTFMGLIPMIDTIIDQLSALNNPDDIPDFQTPHGHAALNSVFHPQIEIGKEANKISYFKYSDNLEDFCKAIWVDPPLERINTTKQTKLILTDTQIEKLNTIYEKDLNLYNSLSQ